MKITNLYTELLKAQQEFPKLVKDSTNPHFKNDYLSLDGLLEKVVPILNKHGIVLIQSASHTYEGHEPTLRTKLVHAESGTEEETTMLLVLDRDSSQGQGSAITYARRYQLLAMLGLAPGDDDDGNAASKTEVKTKGTSTSKDVVF